MDLLQRFDEVKTKRTRLVKVQSLLGEANRNISTKQSELIKLKKSLEKEFKDYQRIQENTLTALFYSILGNKTTKLEKERQEYLLAKLKYDHLSEEIQIAEQHKKDLLSELNALKPFEEEYQDLLLQKEKYLSALNDETSIELQKIQDTVQNLRSATKETKEAILAGTSAIATLKEITNRLNSAENWGVIDLLGGGLISTAVKHSKIDDAKKMISQAQYSINQFTKELKDLNTDLNIQDSIDIGNFYKFSDFFFDGLIFDFVVQEKIQKSTKHIHQIIVEINHICHQLEQENKRYKNDIQKHENRRLEILNGSV